MLYYKEMAQGINLLKEDARLTNVEFDRRAPVEKTVKATQPAAPALTGAAKTLDDAENLYQGKQYEEAKQQFLAVLQQTDRRSQHAAAYYGLARVAASQKNPEDAERLFQKALELEPEAQVKAWTLVYLGRLEMAAQEPDLKQAAKYFQDALQVEGAPVKAREIAQQGLQQISKK
jgi:tetratricopeptide (TPR) repeat protein